MTISDFEKVFKERVQKSMNVLVAKSVDYSRGGDKLHNFKRAGALLQSSPEKALVGMLTKHIVSVLDMVDDIDKGKYHPLSIWDEKLGDAVNYLFLLDALIAERNNKEFDVAAQNELHSTKGE